MYKALLRSELAQSSFFRNLYKEITSPIQRGYSLVVRIRGLGLKRAKNLATPDTEERFCGGVRIRVAPSLTKNLLKRSNSFTIGDNGAY